MSSIDKKAFGISDSLVNAVNEALKGGQVKIDVAEPKGKITGADFKKLRKEKTVAEGNPMNKEKKNAAVAAVGAKNKDSQYLNKMNPSVADKIRGREKMSGNDRKQFEEVEQVDELSGSLAHRAAHGAWIKTDKAKAAFKGQAKAAAQARKFGQYAAKKGYYDAPKKTNEEVEQIDEIGDTKRGQKLINKVHKRASERLGKAVANKDPKNARKYQEVGHQAWDRMPSNKYEEVEQVDELSGSLAHRAAHGAWIKTDKAKAAFKGQAKAAAQARKFGQYAAKKGYYDAPKKTNEEAQQVDELSTDTYHSAAHKAAKRAMGDAQGRSGPIFKKYAGMANKFRDKGMSQEKKEKAVKEDIEQVDEISKKLAARYNNKVAREVGKNQNSGGDPAKLLKRKNREAGHKLSWNKYHNYKVKVPATNEETDPGFAEANDMSKQIAAKKDAFKTQLQKKIAAKQMNVMQAKANKRLSSINASNDKCSCQEGKGKSMTCEMHGDKSKGIKGGKEPIDINPPMREAAELPKKVITKGHEIAKSLIKHRAGVDNPYAVGMAQAKKSAKMKAYRSERDKNKED